MTPITVEVFDQGRSVYRASLDGAAEFGRQNQGEDPPYSQKRKGSLSRVIIARLDETTISRQHVEVEPLPDGLLRVTNRSRNPVKVEPDQILPPAAACDVRLPVSLTVGNKFLRLQAAAVAKEDDDDGPPSSLMSLPDMTLAASHNPDLARLHASIAHKKLQEGSLDSESLLQWIQALLGVLHSAAGTLDFYPRAAKALVDLIGLDSGRVLVREQGRWVVRASAFAGVTRPGMDDEWMPSGQVLRNVQAEKKTFWQDAAQFNPSESLLGVKAVVAAPIIDTVHEVIGILYGERRKASAMRLISKVEVMLVEMLAGGVAAGMARVEQQQEAVKAHGLMQQFFTADLADQLAKDPSLLEPRELDVTMLSCDIRGFSRICHRLGPEKTLEWLHAVLTTLSDCVLGEQGVLVDYVGDELLAMWGAPRAQPDHAARACRAALKMLSHLQPVNERWRAVAEEPIDFAIGINSGRARVGNVGSKYKFKYGALGNTVNLASRIQGATKYLKTRVLIAGATRQALSPSFQTRRVCQVGVINIPEPVELHELSPPDREGWDDLRKHYEEALGYFENREFRQSARVLGGLLSQSLFREDGPSLVLMQRTVTCIVEEPADFTPVWKLPGK